ncbi:hypothetical protein NBRC116587_35910 [Pseudoteredinibacter isoporae]
MIDATFLIPIYLDIINTIKERSIYVQNKPEENQRQKGDMEKLKNANRRKKIRPSLTKTIGLS